MKITKSFAMLRVATVPINPRLNNFKPAYASWPAGLERLRSGRLILLLRVWSFINGPQRVINKASKILHL
eukprot:scaffold42522_cov20-Prasinocladus_malaysianus.AAC.1